MKIIYSLILAIGLVTLFSGCCGMVSNKNSCGPQKSCKSSQGCGTKQSCDGTKGCGDGMQAKGCDSGQKTCNTQQKNGLINKVYTTAKAIGATQGEFEDIKLATHAFKNQLRKFHESKKFPTIEVKDDEVNKELFLKGCKENLEKKAELKYEYIDTVISIFTGEKRDKFIAEFSK